MEDGRRLLLLMDIVTNSVISYEELLETVHHIEYIEISPTLLVKYAYGAREKEIF